MNGTVFDFKKFAVHDGPGIRTTLFLKGCPLGCLWCHNPEGINIKLSLWFFERKCISCKSCIKACSFGALSAGLSDEPFIKIDHDKCTRCGDCVAECPTKALSFDGYHMTVEEAVEELLKDREFYETSGGGITISGGDPVFQPEFSKAVLSACKAKGVHTAIESSMYTKPEILLSFTECTDLFIVDIKLIDNEMHKKYTGTDNRLILENFKKLSAVHPEILVRIPLIPGITATPENVEAVASFAAENAPGASLELINFNPLAESKYHTMDRDYEVLKGLEPLTEAELDKLYSILEKYDLKPVREKKV